MSSVAEDLHLEAISVRNALSRSPMIRNRNLSTDSDPDLPQKTCTVMSCYRQPTEKKDPGTRRNANLKSRVGTLFKCIASSQQGSAILILEPCHAQHPVISVAHQANIKKNLSLVITTILNMLSYTLVMKREPIGGQYQCERYI